MVPKVLLSCSDYQVGDLVSFDYSVSRGLSRNLNKASQAPGLWSDLMEVRPSCTTVCDTTTAI